jgi:hypothetical protein
MKVKTWLVLVMVLAIPAFQFDVQAQQPFCTKSGETAKYSDYVRIGSFSWRLFVEKEYIVNTDSTKIARESEYNQNAEEGPTKITKIYYYNASGPTFGLIITDFTRPGSRRSVTSTNNLSIDQIPDWDRYWTQQSVGVWKSQFGNNQKRHSWLLCEH